jgi:hypothetical protein
LNKLANEKISVEEKLNFNLKFAKCPALLSAKHYEQLKSWLPFQEQKLNFIYKASSDGFTALDFHSRCDNKPNLICLVKSDKDRTFGGYSPLAFNSQNAYISGTGKSFLFQLDENSKHPCKNTSQEIYGYSTYLLTFGGGHDLHICNQPNVNPGSYCNLGSGYEPGQGMVYQNETAKTYLAGSYNFKVLEIEVYQVIF